MFGLNPQITNVVVVLGLMQVAKKIPFEDENVLWAVRGLYILSNVLIVALYMYVGKQIKNKNDMTTLKYVEPATPLSGEEPKLVTTTISQYDEGQLKSLYKSQLTGMAMVGFMHLYMKYTNPLLIQSIIPLKGALEGNLVKIHVWGQPASGDLKRPWKAAGFMGATGGETKSDRKSVEQAEKQYRGGAKEE
ncbi:hypothetical protein TWF694_004029 [Orbilia ellipsospora]|uniref:Inorganic phosphate transport PHO88 n=1 Tax=Orbilia ellipsospora TaxID=2528407 RepID=A0AAV9WYZ7_9PEZI